MTNFVFTIELITINKLLQFLPLKALWGLSTFYVLLQLTTFVCTNTLTTSVWNIATKDYHILQNNINIISYFDYNNIHKLLTALWLT